MRARRNVQHVIVLRASEVATARRGSNPARIHVARMVPSAARRDFRPTGLAREAALHGSNRQSKTLWRNPAGFAL